MIRYGYNALIQFPKSERFSLAVEMKKCMLSILRLIIRANKRYHKKTTLEDLDIELMVLRHYIRLSHDLGYLPPKKYEVWSGLVVELGKMLGGWMKSTRQ